MAKSSFGAVQDYLLADARREQRRFGLGDNVRVYRVFTDSFEIGKITAIWRNGTKRLYQIDNGKEFPPALLPACAIEALS